MNSGKKFDVVLMNPPYANGMHEKFLYKALNISNELVTIQPDSYLYKGKDGNKKIKEILENDYTNIENIDPNKYFDGAFQNRIAILVYSTQHKKCIIVNNQEVDTLHDLSMYFQDKLLMQFENKISPLQKTNCGEKWKGIPGSHYPDRYVENESEDTWCVKCVLIRGNVDASKPDGKANGFYTCITNNEKLIEQQFIGTYEKLSKLENNKGKKKLQYYFTFKNEKEARNFLNYIKTDFVRTCLYLKKKDMNVLWAQIPWFDFSDDVFSKTPKEIDDYLFKKYDISDDIRKHIEEILPDYYNIR